MSLTKNNKLAPCGVYCGACPSFNKTCNGCASNDTQKRKSKFNCKIRLCCYTNKQINYCIECESYPCEKVNKKLLNTHLGNFRFTYRHEIPTIFAKLKTITLKEYLEFQQQRWQCKDCGGIVHFYHYKCNSCGKEQIVN